MKLNLSVADVALLKLVLGEFNNGSTKKHIAALLAKIEKVEMLAGMKRTGITVGAALDAFKGVLGPRLLVPPSSAAGVFGQMAQRLKALGLTAADCVAVAKSANERWPRGAIRAESLVRQADSLLAEAQQDLPGTTRTPTKTYLEDL